MFNPGLQKGETITNRQLMSIFHCACEGGIRYASKTGTIVLVINKALAERPNVISGQSVRFAGKIMKEPGVMAAQNKRLQGFLQEKKPVFLFEATAPGQYRYLGRLAERAAPEIAASEAGASYPVFQLEILED